MDIPSAPPLNPLSNSSKCPVTWKSMEIQWFVITTPDPKTKRILNIVSISFPTKIWLKRRSYSEQYQLPTTNEGEDQVPQYQVDANEQKNSGVASGSCRMTWKSTGVLSGLYGWTWEDLTALYQLHVGMQMKSNVWHDVPFFVGSGTVISNVCRTPPKNLLT